MLAMPCPVLLSKQIEMSNFIVKFCYQREQSRVCHSTSAGVQMSTFGPVVADKPISFLMFTYLSINGKFSYLRCPISILFLIFFYSIPLGFLL